MTIKLHGLAMSTCSKRVMTLLEELEASVGLQLL